LTDRCLLPANDRVAALELAGQVEAERFVAGEARRVARPVADLATEPGGRRWRQLRLGAAFRVLEWQGGHAFGQAGAGGPVGWVASSVLADLPDPTHSVAVPASHAYTAPDLKAPEAMALPFGAALRVVSASGAFFETGEGLFVAKPHLRPLNRPFSDPVTVAQMHFGAPYLWGGNSIWGLDCSGLAEVALIAAGHACPPDSDLQAGLGAALPEGTAPTRGDLFFWPGHVAMAVDGETLIHATAAAMSVIYEPMSEAAARLAAETGAPGVIRRLAVEG